MVGIELLFSAGLGGRSSSINPRAGRLVRRWSETTMKRALDRVAPSPYMSAPPDDEPGGPESDGCWQPTEEVELFGTFRGRETGVKILVDSPWAGAYKPAPSPRRGLIFDIVNLWGRDARAAALKGARRLGRIL
jgi:hypothetical protein